MYTGDCFERLEDALVIRPSLVQAHKDYVELTGVHFGFQSTAPLNRWRSMLPLEVRLRHLLLKLNFPSPLISVDWLNK